MAVKIVGSNEELTEDEATQAFLFLSIFRYTGDACLSTKKLKSFKNQYLSKKIFLMMLRGDFKEIKYIKIQKNNIANIMKNLLDPNELFSFSEVSFLFNSSYQNTVKSLIAERVIISDEEYMSNFTQLEKFKSILKKRNQNLASNEIKLFDKLKNKAKNKRTKEEKLALREGKLTRIQDYSLEEIEENLDSFNWNKILSSSYKTLSKDICDILLKHLKNHSLYSCYNRYALLILRDDIKNTLVENYKYDDLIIINNNIYDEKFPLHNKESKKHKILFYDKKGKFVKDIEKRKELFEKFIFSLPIWNNLVYYFGSSYWTNFVINETEGGISYSHEHGQR